MADRYVLSIWRLDDGKPFPSVVESRTVGPFSSLRRAERLEAEIDELMEEGGRWRCGRPTLLTDPLNALKESVHAAS